MESAPPKLDYSKPFDTLWRYNPTPSGPEVFGPHERLFQTLALETPFQRAALVGILAGVGSVLAGVGERHDGSWKTVGFADHTDDSTLVHPITIGALAFALTFLYV